MYVIEFEASALKSIYPLILDSLSSLFLALSSLARFPSAPFLSGPLREDSFLQLFSRLFSLAFLRKTTCVRIGGAGMSARQIIWVGRGHRAHKS